MCCGGFSGTTSGSFYAGLRAGSMGFRHGLTPLSDLPERSVKLVALGRAAPDFFSTWRRIAARRLDPESSFRTCPATLTGYPRRKDDTTR